MIKRTFLFVIIASFVIGFLFSSCKPSEKRRKIMEAKTRYFTEYNIYSKSDSIDTGIKIFVGVIEGKKYMYHLYEGKNKSQMIVWEMKSETKK